MKLRWAPSLLLLRSLVRELRGIRSELATHNRLLGRLAAVYAPADPETDPAIVAADTGLSYVDATDQALIQAYVAKTVVATGHIPTDDEVLSYLADEKTVDLHRRLVERDQAVADSLRDAR